MKTISKALLLLALLARPATAAISNEGTTRDLDGTEITYSYDNGSTYNVRYTPEGVMYRFVSGEAGETCPIRNRYQSPRRPDHAPC